MALSAFKKVKLRLSRTKECLQVNDAETSPHPPAYEKSEIQTHNSLPKPIVITSPKIPKHASKPWLEVTIEPSYIPEPMEFVTEKSIPQWLWPNSHVRAWLIAVLTNEMKCTPEMAAEIAERDRGIGANLYCRTDVYWNRVLDWQAGEKMYRKLMGMREKEGAVPEFCHVRKR